MDSEPYSSHDPNDLPEGVLHQVPHAEQINALYYDLQAVLSRYGHEFRLPFASVIGVLEMLKTHGIMNMAHSDHPPTE